MGIPQGTYFGLLINNLQNIIPKNKNYINDNDMWIFRVIDTFLWLQLSTTLLTCLVYIVRENWTFIYKLRVDSNIQSMKSARRVIPLKLSPKAVFYFFLIQNFVVFTTKKLFSQFFSV